MVHNLYRESASLSNTMHCIDSREREQASSTPIAIETPCVLEQNWIFEAEDSSQNDLVDLVAQYLDYRVCDSDELQVR